MHNDHIINESCAVALLSKRNYATQVDVNATADATEPQPADLIALSTQVLARNQRNYTRNFNATDELRSHATCATHEVSQLRHNISDLCGFNMIELQKQAGEDWQDVSINPTALQVFAKILYEQKLMRLGQTPYTFTAKTFCNSCQSYVSVPPALSNDGRVLGCPWCSIRAMKI